MKKSYFFSSVADFPDYDLAMSVADTAGKPHEHEPDVGSSEEQRRPACAGTRRRFERAQRRWTELESLLATDDPGMPVRRHISITPRTMRIVRILALCHRVHGMDVLALAVDAFARRVTCPAERSLADLFVHLEQLEHIGEEGNAEAIHVGRLAAAAMDLRDVTFREEGDRADQ